jgi:hypothetical protein
MTDEPTMKLYAFSVAALHAGGEQTAIGVRTAIATLPEGVPAEESGLYIAREIFPESEGWSNHYATAVEIVHDLPLEPYRLVWRLEKSE